ncbi:MAG: VUT family protein [Thermoprotei archaeon]|nr:MAG: VUT family protein [Thermoprotei archaeon]
MAEGEVRVVLTSLFVSSLVVANIAASKLVQFWQLIFPAGTLAYCITFLCTDLYAEFFGRRETEVVVLSGFAASILMVVLLRLSIAAPIAPFQSSYQEVYASVLGSTERIVLASMAAYLVAQSHDVWAFHFWGRLTKGKHLWLRNNASTMVSQLLDTVVFTLIAFWGYTPLQALLNMVIALYLVKWFIALCDTPFCYIGVYAVRRAVGLKPIWMKEV